MVLSYPPILQLLALWSTNTSRKKSDNEYKTLFQSQFHLVTYQCIQYHRVTIVLSCSNIRYLALESMCLLASSEFSREAVKKHLETVVTALKVKCEHKTLARFYELSTLFYSSVIFFFCNVKYIPMGIIYCPIYYRNSK